MTQLKKEVLSIPEEEIEYRKQLVKDSHSIYCPVLLELELDLWDGDIICHDEQDYFVSTKGIARLKELYGDEYIQEKIITYTGFK